MVVPRTQTASKTPRKTPLAPLVIGFVFGFVLVTFPRRLGQNWVRLVILLLRSPCLAVDAKAKARRAAPEPSPRDTTTLCPGRKANESDNMPRPYHDCPTESRRIIVQRYHIYRKTSVAPGRKVRVCHGTLGHRRQSAVPRFTQSPPRQTHAAATGPAKGLSRACRGVHTSTAPVTHPGNRVGERTRKERALI